MTPRLMYVLLGVGSVLLLVTNAPSDFASKSGRAAEPVARSATPSTPRAAVPARPSTEGITASPTRDSASTRASSRLARLLPTWAESALPSISPEDIERGGVWTNGGPRARARPPLDGTDLGVLRDFIEANGLSETSSAADRDDGNGQFEPWEFGFQVWRDGQLVLLSTGASPYISFGYRLEAVPRSVGDLLEIEYLDLGDNELARVPDELGDLDHLRTLRLSQNALEEVPWALGQLAALETLVLDENPLRSLPDRIDRLSGLRVLHLNGTLVGTLPADVTRLPSLEQLSLHRGPGAPKEARLRSLPEGLSEMRLSSLEIGGNALFCARQLQPGPLAGSVSGMGGQRCVAQGASW